VLKLLRLLGGKLDALDPAFHGFSIRKGRLFHEQFPYGLAAADLVVVNYTQSERDALRCKVDDLKAQVSALESGQRALVVPATFPQCWKNTLKSLILRSAKFPKNAPAVGQISQKRACRWRSFSARAGPEYSATQNPDGHQNDAASASLGALDAGKQRLADHGTDPRPSNTGVKTTDNGQDHASDAGQAKGAHAHQNGISGDCEGARQACRQEHQPGLPASHGCDAPKSMDGRASAAPVRAVPSPYPLASQCSVSCPDSGRTISPEGKFVGQHSGSHNPPKYQLCEHWFGGVGVIGAQVIPPGNLDPSRCKRHDQPHARVLS